MRNARVNFNFNDTYTTKKWFCSPLPLFLDIFLLVDVRSILPYIWQHQQKLLSCSRIQSVLVPCRVQSCRPTLIADQNAFARGALSRSQRRITWLDISDAIHEKGRSHVLYVQRPLLASALSLEESIFTTVQIS